MMSLLEKYSDDLESSRSSNSGRIGNDFVQEFEEIPITQKITRLPISSIPKYMGNCIWAFLPNFIPSFFQSASDAKLHPTSYLNGLRGVAAIVVYIDHFAVNWFDPLRRGYGSTVEDSYFIQLPFIRLLYSGRASMAVFFVISGFVLGYKPLKQIHARQIAALLDTVASSAFRRGLRLYIPVAMGTFLSMLMAHWGLYQELPETSTDTLPPRYNSFRDQFEHWLYHMVQVSWPFQEVLPNTPYGPPYNGHLWTIPIEFHGSIVVYVMVFCLSRCRTWVRVGIMWLISLLCLHYERWDLFLFLSGTLLAEGSLLRPGIKAFHETLFSGNKNTRMTFDRWASATNYLLCILALYLLSYPGASYSGSKLGPGYWHESVMHLTPARYTELWFGSERFWISLGGVMLIFSISNSGLLQRIFIGRFAQYLGDISYALHIVHGPISFSFGAWFMNTFTNGSSEGWYAGTCAIAAILNTALCIWMADLFWRGADVKGVVFANWLAEKCWVKDGE